ncbi:MAG: type II toxin-antitoxin system PemK/MazF family toxin [Bdellovibrionales bacterium]|nr:type II toxin-antitoxin system PemK/MazF family toxin [Bdellovibrionales bacterium]
MQRGEIWIGVWPNDPQKTPRPLLIVSNNLRNQAPRLLDVVVVKLTSLEKKGGQIKPTNPSEDVIITLRKSTIVRCASIFTVEKTCLQNKLTQLSVSDMAKVDSCLKTILNLN